jgi:RNA polymerase sigma factor (sigma-70 family)
VRKAKEGDPDSFGELERLSKPLMVHLSDYYSGLHIKFEYDDFYAICRNALYEACVEYDPMNPSFLSYAKTFMVNQCNRELEYWNAEMRNIFTIKEVMVGLERDIDTRYSIIAMATVEDIAFQHQFRDNVDRIITSMFDEEKSKILKLYLFHDLRPRDISDIMEMKYHNIYSIIRRGLEKIEEEYKKRYTLDFSINL